MANFNGNLTPNKIFGSIFNMIISQEVFADNIKGTFSKLVDMARTDGTLYGDTKLYYATDCLESVDWLNDAEAANLLELHRPDAPNVQAIKMDKFRQIRLTVDEYLTKQAWATEGAFSSFNSIMLGWMRDTKRIYDSKLYNAFIGTSKAISDNEFDKQNQLLSYASDDNFGLKVAEKLANILVEVQDADRDYNDLGYMRSYDESDFICIFPNSVYNSIKKIDLPVIFHKEGLLGEFEQIVLPDKYFGTVVGEGGTATTSENNKTVRSLIETKYEVEPEADPRAKKAKDGNYYVHVFPGDLLPDMVTYNQNEAYNEAQNIAFKLIHKRSVPYMSAFEVGTSFFNPRSLTTNHYLTFGHNTLERLVDKPFITVTHAEA
jgi:hypothetical protein